ncbi:MAG: hypothetical protein HKN33_15450 [Pyrinomonadaceae bacterium]|nr:hypothetical protein [Pyrinomonadaceae bacterium]
MKTSKTHPIRLDFVETKDFPSLNRLGMTLAPGKKEQYGIGGQWNRDLDRDLFDLKEQYNTDTLVSLIESHELDLLGITDLPEACKSQGIHLVRFPVEDLSTPQNIEEFAQLVGRIGDLLNEGRTVALHCRAGLGRTGMTAACIIVAISEGEIDGMSAIKMVRMARKGTVETRMQEEFVIDFADRWKNLS